MRVYISGMSSTGKSTLINYIKEHQEMFEALLELRSQRYGIKPGSIIYVEEVAREFFKENSKGYSSYEDLLKNYGDCMEYWGELISYYGRYIREKCCESNYIYIIDRGPIDYKINLTLNYASGTAKQMKDYAMDYNKYYEDIRDTCSDELVFMTNPRHVDITEVEQDGFRPAGLIYRRAMEKSLFEMSISQGTNVILLRQATEDRFAQIVYGIKAKLDESIANRRLL